MDGKTIQSAGLKQAIQRHPFFENYDLSLEYAPGSDQKFHGKEEFGFFLGFIDFLLNEQKIPADQLRFCWYCYGLYTQIQKYSLKSSVPFHSNGTEVKLFERATDYFGWPDHNFEKRSERYQLHLTKLKRSGFNSSLWTVPASFEIVGSLIPRYWISDQG